MVSELGSETRSYHSVIFVFLVSVPRVFRVCVHLILRVCLCDLEKKGKEKEIQSIEKKT